MSRWDSAERTYQVSVRSSYPMRPGCRASSYSILVDSLRSPRIRTLVRSSAATGLKWILGAASLLLPLLLPPVARAQDAEPAGAGRAVASSVERIELTTEGKVSFPVEWYRPALKVPVGTVIFLPDPADSVAAWGSLARWIAGTGLEVIVPAVAVRAVSPRAVWGRPEDPGAPWAAAWEEVDAILVRSASGGESGRPVILGGTGRGAAAAAVAASRLAHAPAALFLVSPAAELTRLPVGPLLAGLGVPALVLAPVDDRALAEAAREIHLAARPACRLWVIDGYACTPRVVASRLRLAVDAVDWIWQQLPGVDRARRAPEPGWDGKGR